MSFSKRKSFPASVKDLDISTLRNSQFWVLTEWMNARRFIIPHKTQEARNNALREIMLANDASIAHAQKGYDVIVHCKMPADGAIAPDVEKKLYAMLITVLESQGESVSDAAARRAAESLMAVVDGVRGSLKKEAQEAVRQFAEKAAPFVVKNNGKIKTVKGVMPPEFKLMLQLASARIPIMLVGPAGCGKTFLCEKLAEALDMEFSDVSCSEGMSEAVFNGKLLPIGKQGSYEHVPSSFLTRYENGGVMLLDEIDAGDPNLFTYINKAIANDSYTVEARWKKPVVRKNEDFVLVAAANTFGNGADSMYVGRNQLDAATLDRFKVGLITMDYSREVEMSIANEDLCKWAWAIRDKIRQHKVRRIMSTRVIKDLAAMSKLYDWKRPEWERAYFNGWTDSESRLVRDTTVAS